MCIKGIAISVNNPRYWSYKDQDTLLLGGSVEDNLFQIPNLEEQLHLLASVGGNYIRCTMSSRDPGDVFPFASTNDIYDLEQPNPEFWRRFDNCLQLTSELGIIMQIEVWDRFDYSRKEWPDNPYNPVNNCNYTYEESGFDREYPEHSGKNKQPFFYTVPSLDNNTLILKYQHRFVDQLLNHSLEFANVLYCMDNETSGSPEWGKYWSTYIQEKASQFGRSIHTTEMWDKWDVTDEMHKNTLDHPETYQFVDMSQNNQTKGQPNWDNLQQVRDYLSDQPRPINMVKIYGYGPESESPDVKDEVHGQQSFWRGIFGGCASARFHRPKGGLGLTELAQANIKSMRLVEAEFDNFFAGMPAAERLTTQQENQAFCFAETGKTVAVVGFRQGTVTVDVSDLAGSIQIKHLDIHSATWDSGKQLVSDGTIELQIPNDGFHAWVMVRV